jgi:hypothetical protein
VTKILTHCRSSQSLASYELSRAKAIKEITELAVGGQADTRENQTESKITYGIKSSALLVPRQALVSSLLNVAGWLAPLFCH